MHPGERTITTALVRRPVRAQFPRWASLPVTPLASGGTVNAVHRLGDDLTVRLPRTDEPFDAATALDVWAEALDGPVGVGDPACDLIPAWNLLTAATRPAFRDAVGADDAAWARGRGRALSMAVIQLPYYRSTNPVISANARYVLTELGCRSARRASTAQRGSSGRAPNTTR